MTRTIQDEHEERNRLTVELLRKHMERMRAERIRIDKRAILLHFKKCDVCWKPFREDEAA